MLTLMKKIIVYPIIAMMPWISAKSMAGCEMNVLQKFDDGLIAQVEMINSTGRVLEDWSARLFLINGYLESIWGDGVHSEINNFETKISSASWEGPVGIGESRVFYFKASTLDGTALVKPLVGSTICALPTPVKGFTVSDFTVSYYHEDDGQIPGQGTDGFDPNITETLVAQDVVDEIYIDNLSPGFENINLYNLFASWEGTINVFDDSNPVTVDIFSLFGSVNIFVDGELIESNYNNDLILNLSEGGHIIRVDYHSHFEIPLFDVSFD